MINHNKSENEKGSHININRPRSRHGHKYSKYRKVSQYNNAHMH